MTIMKNITEDSLPKKSEIDDMWLELFRVHNRKRIDYMNQEVLVMY